LFDDIVLSGRVERPLVEPTKTDEFKAS